MGTDRRKPGKLHYEQHMEKLEPGTVIAVGQHETEIVAYLAEGGFAHIYKVRCTPQEDGREYAVLKRVLVKTKPELNLLRKEVDTMKRLAHSKYVVRYYDSNAQKLDDGTYEVLLLMEYCPNKSLLDFMNLHLKTKLRVDQITKIMYQISQGLADMHELKLIHRDLKIENILIDYDENFKLADFGSSSTHLAAPTNQEEFQIVAHDIIHNTTPQYRAPEMIDLYRGLPIDGKSDIWALGVFLFKLMYYTTPFETQGELAILHGYFQFPEHPKYPSRLKNLVIIMLQVNPMLRPNIYQVLCEICDMTNRPIPIKDTYGMGKYDFDAYAKYQQHIQMQQQQQAQLQQQYFLQKQQEQAQLQERQAQNLGTSQPPSGHPSQEASPQPPQASLEPQQTPLKPQQHQVTPSLEDPTFKKEKSEQSIHPQELTRSSKSSVGDLKSLGESLNQKQDDEDNTDFDLDNVNDRFPELEDIEAVKQKYPEVLDANLESVISPTSKAEASGSGKTDEMSKTTSKEFPGLDERENETPNMGLKLSSTDAWTVPAKEVDVQVDGVFHKADTKEAKKPDGTFEKEIVGQPQPEVLKVKNSFDNLFDFDSKFSVPASQYADVPTPVVSQHGPKVPSQTQPSSRIASQTDARAPTRFNTMDPVSIGVSRNPFPAPSAQVSKNPFPTLQQQSTSSSLDVKKALRPERSGGNPWAQFTQQQQSQQYLPQMSSQPSQQQYTSQMPPKLPSSQQLYTKPQAPAPQSQPQPQQRMPSEQKPDLPTRPNDRGYTTPKLRPKSTVITSPTITLTPAEERLIDLDDTPSEHRPKLDLHMRQMALDSPIPTSADAGSDTDTDSNGDLKVEVMKVRSTSKSSGEMRRSSELNRLNLDLQELDLDEEAVDDGEGARHSRRSLSLKRSGSSTQRKTSRSRSAKFEEQRKSFLGF